MLTRVNLNKDGRPRVTPPGLLDPRAPLDRDHDVRRLHRRSTAWEVRAIVSTAPLGRNAEPIRLYRQCGAGRAATFSSTWVICLPMTAILSTTPLPTCGPSSGRMIEEGLS
jgi:hypothetical protein